MAKAVSTGETGGVPAITRDRSEFLWVGGHPAMDLLNTVVAQDGVLVDLWTDDAKVLRWLRDVGLLRARMPAGQREGALLKEARRLRAAVRAMAEARREARPVGVSMLNGILSGARRSLQLVAAGGTRGGLELVEQMTGPEPAQMLAPLAESAARLLAEAKPDQLRRCQGNGCVLWFYDNTPTHRRRWCSMEVCGNRAKVSAFRERVRQ